MKRLLFLLIAATLVCQSASAKASTITVTPTNPRIYSRFIYNYRSVLQDFEIDPDISEFVSVTGNKSFPAFIVRGNDGFLYAVSAADIVAFADRIEVTVTDSTTKISYQDLQVVNVSENLNLAVTRLPKGANVQAIEIDSVWFKDESEQYTQAARIFLKGVPMEIPGDENSLGVLYNRMAEAASDGYYYILPNLSYRYLYSKTADQIADGIDSLSESDYQLFRRMNSNGDLIGAMRILAGDMAAKRMKRNLQVTNTVVKENSIMLEGENGEQITFEKEFGAWRIVTDAKPQAGATSNTATYTAATESTAETPTNSDIEQDIYGMLVTGKVMVPYSFRNQGVSGSFAIGFAFRFLTVEAIFIYNSFGVYRDQMYDPYFNEGVPRNSDYHYSNFIGLGLRVGGMLPIHLNDRLTFAPTLKFEWDTPYLCRETNSRVNSISPIVGGDLYVRLRNNGRSRFFVGVQYEHKFNFNIYRMVLKQNNMGYINLNFGFVF